MIAKNAIISRSAAAAVVSAIAKMPIIARRIKIFSQAHTI